MRLSFNIEQANFIRSSGLYLLDGILTEGAIENGARGYIAENPGLVIVVKNVGLVNPPREQNHLTISIEEPSCPIESLRGMVLIGY